MTPPLVVIVGQTGVGKTALAIELAKRFNGEIIAADSRTVYTGMDIGTAKPTVEERSGIPHYGLDIVDHGQSFSAYEFKQLAQSAVENISSRGKLPILVGGTGLYIDAFLYDFHFRPKPKTSVRQTLLGLSIEELQERLLARNQPLPENQRNPRHLARVLESGEPPKQQRRLRQNTLVLGLIMPQQELRVRLEKRVDVMVKAGLVDEVRRLMAKYGEVEALRAPGYKAIALYIQGRLTLAEAKMQFARDDARLAKRQRTWFRRSRDIIWLEGPEPTEQAVQLVTQFLHR